jgi:hypothetical protein
MAKYLMGEYGHKLNKGTFVIICMYVYVCTYVKYNLVHSNVIFEVLVNMFCNIYVSLLLLLYFEY